MATETTVILFSDLVGSTSLLARLGEAAAEELRREVFDLSRRALAGDGGREVKNTGDGLMVAFPTPSAALDAAVRLQQAVDTRNQGAAEPVQLRVGMSMGECDVDADDYFGRPVVEAARLCDAAAAHQILVSDVVRLLAGARGGHEFVSLGGLALKGLDDEVPASEVRWAPAPDPAALPFPARLGRSPGALFVGRELERGVLLDALKAAVGGARRRVALVSGEPGIGKTTLLSELAATVVDEGGAVLYGRCEEDLSVPYQPWREVVATVAAHRPELLGDDDPLAALTGTARERAASETETERYLLLGAVVQLLARLSEQRPVVVVLDDLHWADGPTVALLRHVVAAAAPLRVLVVGTFRDADLGSDDPLADALAALHREEGVERIHLRGLSDVEVLSLLEQLAGHTMDDSGLDLRDALLAETTGNPFFLVEMLRHLAETGAIRQDAEGRWQAAVDLRGQSLPVSVREVVGRRIDRLGPDVRRTLEHASVLGRDFELPVLAAMLDRTEDETLDLVEPAVEFALVRDVAPGRFSFAHALTEHTLYDGLSPTRRARAHALAAAVLEDRIGADTGPRAAELAHHWAAASTPHDVGKAVAYSIQAGDHALGQLAPEEAARWYERALELVGEGDGPDVRHGRAAALAGLAEAQRHLGVPTFQAHAIEAGRLAREAGDTATLTRAALAVSRGLFSQLGTVVDEVLALLRDALAAVGDAPSATRGRLLVSLANELVYGDAVEARALAKIAIAEARTLDDELVLAEIADRVGNPLRWPGGQERVALLEEVHATIDLGERPQMELDVEVSLASALLESRGDIAAARACLDRATELADRIGRPYVRWLTLLNEAGVAMFAGDIAAMESLSERAFAIGSASGQPDALRFYGIHLIAARRMQGRAAEIVGLLEQAHEELPQMTAYRLTLAMTYAHLGRDDEALILLRPHLAAGFGAIPMHPEWMLCMYFAAEAVATLGLPEPARELYELIAPWEDGFASVALLTYGVYHLPLARLASTLGDAGAAGRHFARAEEVHARVGARYALALTHLEWARHLGGLGGSDDARVRDLATRARDVAVAEGYERIAADAEVWITR